MSCIGQRPGIYKKASCVCPGCVPGLRNSCEHFRKYCASHRLKDCVACLSMGQHISDCAKLELIHCQEGNCNNKKIKGAGGCEDCYDFNHFTAIQRKLGGF